MKAADAWAVVGALGILAAVSWNPQGAESAPTPTIAAIQYAAAGQLPLEPAIRVTPPTVVIVTTTTEVVPGVAGTTVEGRCTQYEPLLIEHAPEGGWDVGRMSAFMWRESRCEPWQRSTTSDSGALQINDINHPYLRTALGEWVDRYTLLDPVQNVRASAALCTFWRRAGLSCYQPWGGRGL